MTCIICENLKVPNCFCMKDLKNEQHKKKKKTMKDIFIMVIALIAEIFLVV